MGRLKNNSFEISSLSNELERCNSLNCWITSSTLNPRSSSGWAYTPCDVWNLLMWAFNVPIFLKIHEHWLHGKLGSPSLYVWHLAVCDSKLPFCTNVWGHCVQRNIRPDSEWRRWCMTKVFFWFFKTKAGVRHYTRPLTLHSFTWAKHWSHLSHLNGFWPLWIRSCRINRQFLAKSLPQYWQLSKLFRFCLRCFASSSFSCCSFALSLGWNWLMCCFSIHSKWNISSHPWVHV